MLDLFSCNNRERSSSESTLFHHGDTNWELQLPSRVLGKTFPQPYLQDPEPEALCPPEGAPSVHYTLLGGERSICPRQNADGNSRQKLASVPLRNEPSECTLDVAEIFRGDWEVLEQSEQGKGALLESQPKGVPCPSPWGSVSLL